MHRTLKTGGAPAAFYGTRVTGMAPAQLASLRAIIGQVAFGPARGRSRTLQFLLNQDHQLDPTYKANSLPLCMWLQAILHGWVPKSMLATCWRHYQACRAVKWTEVLGPTGAVCATLPRLGWEGVSFDRWKIGDGLEIDLSTFGRRSLHALIDRGTCREMLRYVSVPSSSNVMKPPMINVIRQELQAFRKRGDADAAIFLSGVVAGGYPSQLQLFLDRKVVNPFCLLCGQVVGTPKHRFSA